MRMVRGKVEVVGSKGCSRLILGMPSLGGVQSFEPVSPAPSFSIASGAPGQSTGPFSGLVICVTGLSKEARKQVMDATERLGGQYSPNLHPQCTHLVVQSFAGRKLEHALKHGSKNGLFVVTLGWFVDSVKRNMRLGESLYSVKNVGENGNYLDELNRVIGYSTHENSCLPVGIYQSTSQAEMTKQPHLWFSGRDNIRSIEKPLFGLSMYLDLGISSELRTKTIEAAAREGATFVDQWFAGCQASYVVCEGPSVGKYLGHSNNIVTPLWVLKTAKEKYMQRLVHMSADLARQVRLMLENSQVVIEGKEITEDNVNLDNLSSRSKLGYANRQQIVNLAKLGVRNRRGHRMQICQTPLRPITPSGLLDSICWSVSEVPTTASVYTDSFSAEDTSEQHTGIFFDAKEDGKESEASFMNFSRPLTESEKAEVIFKNHFLTILFPVDRYAEMGPSARTFFDESGFTCLEVLDHIYAFYQIFRSAPLTRLCALAQENMSAHEIKVAIHTDSRHADRLRSVYSAKETADHGHVVFKRIDFLGSRRSLEMLKRVSGDNNSNVYELLLRA